jgi:hypothetical protein
MQRRAIRFITIPVIDTTKVATPRVRFNNSCRSPSRIPINNIPYLNVGKIVQ